MITSTPRVISSLLAVAIAGALTTIHARPAAAQSATDVVCDGCVQSRDIKDRTIRSEDLADSVLFGRTVFVPFAGNATANCDALREALAQINDASAKNPVLVKLDRGNYQCGSTPLAMRPFVTIEGAGLSFSRIIGDVDGSDIGVITGANEAGLRRLTVEHAGTEASVAIVVNTLGRRMTLTDVAIKLDSEAVIFSLGIYAGGGILDLTNVSVRTHAPNAQSTGILGESGVRLNMMDVWVHNQSGNIGNPAALELRDTSSVTGYGVLFSSNVFGLLGRDNSFFELFGGSVIGGRGSTGTPSFTCVGVAKEDFTARAANCT
jgi:hypothetical protein